MDSTETSPAKSFLGLKISLALLLCLVGLLAPFPLLSAADNFLHLDPLVFRLIEAILASSFIVTGIWLLRNRLDQGHPLNIGIGKLRHALLNFVLGFGLLLAPLLISLLITTMSGWAQITINWEGAQIDLILMGMVLVFFTDALPEELVFRGYIFSNFLDHFVKWKSALYALFLFVLFPVILIPAKGLLGPNTSSGIVENLSAGYIGYLIFFGAFATYLRILTKSIWTSVGFHLMFVYINQLTGLNSSSLVQFTEVTSQGMLQGSFAGLLLLTFIGVIVYPKIKGIQLHWSSKDD